MTTHIEKTHRERFSSLKCPICNADSGFFDWLKEHDGTLIVARQDVQPITSPTIVTGGISMGGVNFLKAFRLCRKCGYSAAFNLTYSRDDPENRR